MNGCCIAVWIANGKVAALSFFTDNLFPKQTYYIREMLPLETKHSGVKLLPQSDLWGGMFLEEMSCKRYCKKECKEQKEHHSYKIGTWKVRTLMRRGKLQNLKKEMLKNVSVLGVIEVRGEDKVK